MKKLISGLLAFVMFTTPVFGASTRTIETTNTEGVYSAVNLIRDAGFEGLNKAAAWVASGGTLSTTTTTPGRGNVSGTWDASATSQTLKSKLVTIPPGLQGKNGVVSCTFKAASGVAAYTLTAFDGTNDIITAQTITSSTSAYVRTSVNFIFPLTGSVQLKMTSTQDEVLVNIDDCFLGSAEGFNLANVSQATFVGALTFPGAASCSWTRTSNATFGAYAADSDCVLPVGSNIEGNVAAPATKYPSITLKNVNQGVKYRIEATGFFNSSTVNAACSYRFSDGTTSSTPLVLTYGTAGSVDGAGILVGDVTFPSGGDKSMDIQTTGLDGNYICNLDNGWPTTSAVRIAAYKFPSTSETIYQAGQFPPVSVQKFTTGSGTYTKPLGVSYIRVKLAGGGGGGSGSISGSGGSGGNTSFTNGVITLQGNAGSGAAPAGNGGAGGTVSNTVTGDVSVIVEQTGPDGGGSAWIVGDAQARGGDGGSTPFAGAGLGGGNGSGSGPGKAAQANTGSGGGGGATRVTTNNHGAGGGAGGYVEAIIRNPTNFTYTIGTGGTGGTGAAGTAAAANGGAGGSGVVIVEEYYASLPAPVFIGSVTSNSSGAERIERATIAAGGSTSSQSGSWLSTSTLSATGQYTLTIASGMFSSTPSCTCSGASSAGISCTISSASTSSILARTRNGVNADENDGLNIICMGPR